MVRLGYQLIDQRPRTTQVSHLLHWSMALTSSSRHPHVILRFPGLAGQVPQPYTLSTPLLPNGSVPCSCVLPSQFVINLPGVSYADLTPDRFQRWATAPAEAYSSVLVLATL